MSAETESIDHKAEALKELERAAKLGSGSGGTDLAIPLHLQAAVVYSNLAIAEGQERVAEALESANEDRREQRASAVEELRGLIEQRINNPLTERQAGEWDERARMTLALYEAVEHA